MREINKNLEDLISVLINWINLNFLAITLYFDRKNKRWSNNKYLRYFEHKKTKFEIKIK